MVVTLRLKFHEKTWQRVLQRKDTDGFGRLSIEEWLEWLTQGEEVTGSMSKLIQRRTRTEMAPLWMKNFALNLPKIRASSLGIRQVKAEPWDGYAVVVGRGPSMFRGNHLKVIRESEAYARGALKVSACDGALKDCIAEGIYPNIVVGVDGSPVCKKWFEDISVVDLDEMLRRRTRILLATQTHPDTVAAAESTGLPVHWFAPSTDDAKRENSLTLNLGLMTCSEVNPDGVVAIECGGNVGTATWHITWNILGFKNICLVGMDMGYPKGMPFTDTYYWSTVSRQIPSTDASLFYEDFYNPFTGETYVTDPVFRNYRDSFKYMAERTPDWLRTSNASSGSLYHPPFITPVKLEQWLKEVK